MKIQQIFLVLLLALGFTSCENKAEQLFAQAMALHDEIMPQSPVVRAYIDSLEAIPESVAFQNDSIMVMKTDLEGADKWMKKWMHEFDPALKEDETYLGEQVEQLRQMKDHYNKSLSNVKNFFRTHK